MRGRYGAPPEEVGVDTPSLQWIPLPEGAAVPLLAFGPDEGPPVLVLPGLSDGCAPLSDGNIRAQVQPPPRPLRRHRVLLMSYRHPLPRDPGTEELAADAAAVIERVVGGPVSVTGHSMGGMVAQHLAASRPDLVERLVLSATTAAAGDALVARLERWERLLVAGRHRDFVRDAVSVSYTGAELRTRRFLARLGSAPDLAAHVARHLALSSACRTHDARHRIGDVAAPTLVLAGTEDPLMPLPAVRRLAEALPDARLVELAGLAHGLPEQGRRRYVRELAGFLPDRAGEVAS